MSKEAQAEFDEIADRYLSLPLPRRDYNTWTFPRPVHRAELINEGLIWLHGTAKCVLTACGYAMVMAREA